MTKRQKEALSAAATRALYEVLERETEQRQELLADFGPEVAAGTMTEALALVDGREVQS